MFLKLSCAPILFCAATVAIASGDVPSAPRSLSAARIEKPPVIDGIIDDAEWAGVPVADRFCDIFSNTLATESTLARLAYDGEAIYIGFTCYDKVPSEIVAREIRPGAQLFADDCVIFTLDPFATQSSESLNRFIVNARGTMTEDIAGGRAAKREWRGQWQAATKINADSWTCEMRIPWKLLEYPAGASKKLMTFNFVRFHQRTKQRYYFSNITASEKLELRGRWEGVEPPVRKAKPELEMLPSLVTDYDQDRKTFSIDPGLDAKLTLPPNMTGIVSLNPDFRNIEQSVESIDFSRSERFLGDNRAFFKEGESYLGTLSQHGIGRLLYSRRIRDFDLGAKVYGRLNDGTQVGGFATMLGDDEYNAMARVSKPFGSKTQVMLMGTGHRSAGARETVTAGRMTQKLNNKFELFAEAATLSTRNMGTSAYTTTLDYSDNGLYSSIRHINVPQDFRPALALIPYTGYNGYTWFTTYGTIRKTGPVQGLEGNVFITNTKDFKGHGYQEGFDFNAQTTFRNGAHYEVFGERRLYAGIRDEYYGAAWVSDVNNRFNNLVLISMQGHVANTPYREDRVEASMRVFGHLDLGLRAQLIQMNGPQEQYVATAGWEFDAKRSLTGRLVKNGKDINSYIAYRSSGFAGNELFVIFGDPNARKSRARIGLKFVMPIN